MKHPFWWCFGILAVLAVVFGGWAYDEGSQSLNHIFTLNPSVPASATPEPTAFCNTPHQYGGLANMVATVGEPVQSNTQFFSSSCLTSW